MVKPDKLNIDAEKPKDSSIFITGFSDASFCSKTKAYGCAVWIKHNNEIHKDSFGGINLYKNAKEVEERAFKFLVDKILKLYPDLNEKIIVLQSDCLHMLREQSYTRRLYDAGAEHVKIKHVKAHSSNTINRTTVNAIVDTMAKKEMNKFRKTPV